MSPLTAAQRAKKQAQDRAYRLRKKAGQADAQLVALAEVEGVVAGSIAISPLPRPGRHGHHVVTWHQDGRSCTSEGYTLTTALGRAVRSARAKAAKAAG